MSRRCGMLARMASHTFCSSLTISDMLGILPYRAGVRKPRPRKQHATRAYGLIQGLGRRSLDGEDPKPKFS